MLTMNEVRSKYPDYNDLNDQQLADALHSKHYTDMPKEEFYSNLKKALKVKGIVVSQSESMFYNKDLIQDMFEFKRKHFNVVRYYYTLVPTYPSGTIGFHFCSDGHYLPIDINNDSFDRMEGLKYYNEMIHNSSFLTPNGVSN